MQRHLDDSLFTCQGAPCQDIMQTCSVSNEWDYKSMPSAWTHTCAVQSVCNKRTVSRYVSWSMWEIRVGAEVVAQGGRQIRDVSHITCFSVQAWIAFLTRLNPKHADVKADMFLCADFISVNRTNNHDELLCRRVCLQSYLLALVVTLHTFFLSLNNCFSLVPSDCPRAPLGGKSCLQTGSLARAGTCQVLPGLWTASWLWTVAAGGGNQSVSIPHLSSFLSFYLSISCSLSLSSPAAPPAQCVSAAIESFMFTGRREGDREETRGEEGGCNPPSKEAQWFLRIKGIKAEKTNKASACSHDHPILDWS